LLKIPVGIFLTSGFKLAFRQWPESDSGRTEVPSPDEAA